MSARASKTRGVFKRTWRDPTTGRVRRTVWVALIRVKPFAAVSKTFEQREDAEAYAKATRAELTKRRRAGEARADLSKLTIGGLIREHLEDPVVKSLKSYETLHDRLDWWTAHHGKEHVRDVSVLTLRSARTELARGRSPATVNRYMSVMRRAWNWGRSAGLVSLEKGWPSRDLMLTEPKGRVRYLSDDELAALLGAIDANAARFPALRALILVSLGCGLRQGELLRLTWADLDLERATARVLLTKNDESRSVYVPAAAVEALRALKKRPVVHAVRPFLDRDGAPITKSTLQRPWEVVRAAAGLGDFRWHDLRHSCASYLAQNGASLLEIGSVLGHKSPSMTMRYAHLVAGKAVTGHAKLDEKLRGKP